MPDKTVPEKDLLAVKFANEKNKEEKIHLQKRNAQLEAEMQILKRELEFKGVHKAEEDGAEPEKVKEYLVNWQNELNKQAQENARKDAEFEQKRSEMERSNISERAKALATQFGVEAATFEGLDTLDAVERKAVELRAEKAEAEAKEYKEKLGGAPKPAYEAGSPAVGKVGIPDMPEDKWQEYLKQQRNRRK